jgi:hypothetical protein
MIRVLGGAEGVSTVTRTAVGIPGREPERDPDATMDKVEKHEPIGGAIAPHGALRRHTVGLT